MERRDSALLLLRRMIKEGQTRWDGQQLRLFGLWYGRCKASMGGGDDVHGIVMETLRIPSRDGVRKAIALLSGAYIPPDEAAPEVHFERASREEDRGGKANARRIVIYEHALLLEFQHSPSPAIPDYAERFGVTHLAVVVLHEFGHVLAKRKLLAEDTEQEATRWALRFLGRQQQKGT